MRARAVRRLPAPPARRRPANPCTAIGGAELPDVTIAESHRDLLDSAVATLATVGRDGRPQLSEVWFLAEGDTVGISLNRSRQKTKNLERNPACNLFILDLGNP